MPTAGRLERRYCRRSRLTRSNKSSGGSLTFVGLTDTRGVALWGRLVFRQMAYLFTLPIA
jgi:hypothetical protein